MRNSLRFRLTAILIGLAVGPLVLAGAILAQRSFGFEQTQAFNLQRQVAQNVSTEVEAFFLGINTDLNSLGDEIRSLDTADRAQQLSLMLSATSTGSQADVYDELTLLDNQGQERVRLSRQEIVPTDQLIDRSGKAEFLQPKSSRQIYYSPVQNDATTGKSYIIIAIPLFERRSVTLTGVLIAKIKFETVGSLIQSIQVGENQTIYIADTKGNVVAHQDRAINLQGAHINLPDTFARQSGLNGVSVILAVNRFQLGEQTFTIVAEKPTAQALAFAYTTISTIIVVIIFALVLAIVLGAISVRQIVIPIEGLALTAQHIAAGDMSQQATVTRQDEIGVLANTFNNMTSQLRDSIGNLEARVTDRTKELVNANQQNERRAKQFEAISQIARTISSTRDLDSLLVQITEVINREFGFYHVGVFLVDTAREYAVLSAANSDGGRRMLERSHRLKVGETGLVGFVTSSGKARVALDTGTDAVFFNNPDLPDTRSEIALPLRVSEEIIGALDVQSTEPNAFNQEDVNILSTLADQVSIAIQNARQFEQTHKALTESNALSKQFIQTGWSQFTRSNKLEGIRHTGAKTTLLYKKSSKDKETGSSDRNQLKTKGRGAILSLPIKLRGEVIGSVDVRSQENRQWEQDELDIVTAIIERSAIAMENARLLADSQKLAAKERTISDISAKISAQSDVDELLKTAAQELSRTLPGMEIAIQLKKDETE